MIWFACKKCGKTHGRSESSAGALVFCECGQGNSVPWESTATESVVMSAVELPAVPDLAPLSFAPEVSSAPPARSEDRPRRGGRAERRDPGFCFNHQHLAKSEACADCKEAFCTDCLVQFQDATLCGPCKNFRTRRLELPPLHSSFATASAIVCLLAGPLAIGLLFWSHTPAARVLSLVALLALGIALALGIWALRKAEKEGGGHTRALIGITGAAVTSIVIVLVQVCVARGII